MTAPLHLQPPAPAAVELGNSTSGGEIHQATFQAINKADEADTPLLLKRTSTFRAPQSHVAYKPEDGFITKVWGTKTAPAAKLSESLDYETPQNRIFNERLAVKKSGKKKLWGYTGHTFAKFMVTFAIGVITGCFATALSYCVGILSAAKLNFIQDQMDAQAATGNYAKAALYGFLWFWLFGGIMVTIATSMVQYWAPTSAGAGVTLVMAFLNGNHIPNLLRFSTLITKFIGTVFAVSSGLPMGPEGPMVHIGACVASVITYMDFKSVMNGKLFGRLKVKETQLKENLKVLDEIVSDSDHREFVSAGATAGIAAAFGAPVGGVLFAMEEACTFWSKKTAWRCFLAAALSVYTIQIINPVLGKGAISFVNVKPLAIKEWAMQLPFLLVDFAMAGLLGAAFNSIRMWLWKVRAAKTLHLQRIGEVIGLVFLVGACAFFFSSTMGKCLQMPDQWWEGEEGGGRRRLLQDDGMQVDGGLVAALDGTVAHEVTGTESERVAEYGIRFLCPAGQHNDLATLFLSKTHETIIKLFSMGYGSAVIDSTEYVQYFTVSSLAIYLVCYLILMSIGAGLAIPGGLFMPSIVMGASWGGMWGYFIRHLIPSWNIQPGLYAMLAATGVLGGVFRSAISLVVLMVEGTRGIDFLFGIILAVVVANWVAHLIHHDGVYESELERVGKSVYMLQSDPPSSLQTETAENIMASGVIGFKSIEAVSNILSILRNTQHNGFPVWAKEIDLEATGNTLATGEVPDKRLEGIILRSQLLVLLQRRHFVDSEGRPVGREDNSSYELELESEMRTFFRRYYTHCRYVSSSSQPLDGLELDAFGSETLTSLHLDLRPYMNRSPVTIRKECAATRAHQVFVNLNMRHLFVVDQWNNVVGMITREDLDRAAGHGWWRVAPIAEQPQKKSVSKMMAKVFGLNFASRGNQPPTTPSSTPLARDPGGLPETYQKPLPSRLGH